MSNTSVPPSSVLTLTAVLLLQEEKEAGANYPASFNLKFLDRSTGKEWLISSPMPVEARFELVPVTWTFVGFLAEQIRYTKNGGGVFMKLSCQSVSGVIAAPAK